MFGFKDAVVRELRTFSICYLLAFFYVISCFICGVIAANALAEEQKGAVIAFFMGTGGTTVTIYLRILLLRTGAALLQMVFSFWVLSTPVSLAGAFFLQLSFSFPWGCMMNTFGRVLITLPFVLIPATSILLAGTRMLAEMNKHVVKLLRECRIPKSTMDIVGDGRQMCKCMCLCWFTVALSTVVEAIVAVIIS